jgi:hypothetical protein
VQVGQLADLAVEERAALALGLGGLAGVPHVEVDDQLAASLEHIKQTDRALRADQGYRGLHLDHRQPAASGRDRVALAGVRLLADQQLGQLRLPGVPVRHRREVRFSCRGPRA